MDCRNCQEDLTAYLDGELPDSTAGQIEVHVAECRECAGELRSLEEAGAFCTANAHEVEVDPEIWRSVRARISTLEIRPAKRTRFELLFGRGWVAATATLAAIAVIALTFWTYRSHQIDQQNLQQYMAHYLQTREQQEKAHSVPDLRDVYPDYPDNPFMTVRATNIDNPFRPEAQ